MSLNGSWPTLTTLKSIPSCPRADELFAWLRLSKVLTRAAGGERFRRFHVRQATERLPHAIARCGDSRTPDKVQPRRGTPNGSSGRIERLHQSDTRARASTYGECIGTARRRQIEGVGSSSRQACLEDVVSKWNGFLARADGRRSWRRFTYWWRSSHNAPTDGESLVSTVVSRAVESFYLWRQHPGQSMGIGPRSLVTPGIRAILLCDW